MAIEKSQQAQRMLIGHCDYLADKRDSENGDYKYVTTEGEVSTTWYSWCDLTGRYTCTMDGLIQLDLELDAKREANRLPDDPPITPSTYHQKRIPQKCRLINYPDDLLPATEDEIKALTDLKALQAKIDEFNEFLEKNTQ